MNSTKKIEVDRKFTGTLLTDDADAEEVIRTMRPHYLDVRIDGYTPGFTQIAWTHVEDEPPLECFFDVGLA